MKEPLITAQAEADLEETWEYVAHGGAAKADRFIDRLLKQAGIHAQFPLTGRSREDLAPGLRSFVVKPFVVFFRSKDETIEIIRVLHGRRDVDTIMKDAD